MRRRLPLFVIVCSYRILLSFFVVSISFFYNFSTLASEPPCSTDFDRQQLESYVSRVNAYYSQKLGWIKESLEVPAPVCVPQAQMVACSRLVDLFYAGGASTTEKLDFVAKQMEGCFGVQGLRFTGKMRDVIQGFCDKDEQGSKEFFGICSRWRQILFTPILKQQDVVSDVKKLPNDVVSPLPVWKRTLSGGLIWMGALSIILGTINNTDLRFTLPVDSDLYVCSQFGIRQPCQIDPIRLSIPLIVGGTLMAGVGVLMLLKKI